MAATSMLTSGVSFDATTHLLVRNYARNHERVGVSVEQLSTGKRINRPSDDPAGFVAAEEIRRELQELEAQGRAATFGRANFFANN
jgi:flagellar hook-associated protein 3 FlgL